MNHQVQLVLYHTIYLLQSFATHQIGITFQYYIISSRCKSSQTTLSPHSTNGNTQNIPPRLSSTQKVQPLEFNFFWGRITSMWVGHHVFPTTALIVATRTGPRPGCTSSTTAILHPRSRQRLSLTMTAVPGCRFGWLKPISLSVAHS